MLALCEMNLAEGFQNRATHNCLFAGSIRGPELPQLFRMEGVSKVVPPNCLPRHEGPPEVV
jgi:hypothetical protein